MLRVSNLHRKFSGSLLQFTSHSAPPQRLAVVPSHRWLSAQAQVFIDLNWIDRQLTQIALKRYGQEYESLCAFDASPLIPFLESRVAEVLSAQSVEITAAYAYGSLKKDKDRAQGLGSVRAFAEEGISVRNFSTTSADAACAPAVSFASDLVHACAIRGGNVDTGLPLSAPPGLADAAVAPLQPTNIVVALIGSPVYFPALVRAMQHDRTVVVGSCRADWVRLLQAMLPEQRSATPPVLLDEVLASMLVPVAQFQARALPISELARRLHEALLARPKPDAPASGADVASIMLDAGLLKELRRRSFTALSLLSSQPRLFSVTKTATAYTVRPRPTTVLEAAPSEAAASVIAHPEAAPSEAAHPEAAPSEAAHPEAAPPSEAALSEAATSVGAVADAAPSETATPYDANPWRSVPLAEVQRLHAIMLEHLPSSSTYSPSEVLRLLVEAGVLLPKNVRLHSLLRAYPHLFQVINIKHGGYLIRPRQASSSPGVDASPSETARDDNSEVGSATPATSRAYEVISAALAVAPADGTPEAVTGLSRDLASRNAIAAGTAALEVRSASTPHVAGSSEAAALQTPVEESSTVDAQISLSSASVDAGETRGSKAEEAPATDTIAGLKAVALDGALPPPLNVPVASEEPARGAVLDAIAAATTVGAPAADAVQASIARDNGAASFAAPPSSGQMPHVTASPQAVDGRSSTSLYDTVFQDRTPGITPRPSSKPAKSRKAAARPVSAGATSPAAVTTGAPASSPPEVEVPTVTGAPASSITEVNVPTVTGAPASSVTELEAPPASSATEVSVPAVTATQAPKKRARSVKSKPASAESTAGKSADSSAASLVGRAASPVVAEADVAFAPQQNTAVEVSSGADVSISKLELSNIGVGGLPPAAALTTVDGSASSSTAAVIRVATVAAADVVPSPSKVEATPTPAPVAAPLPPAENAEAVIAVAAPPRIGPHTLRVLRIAVEAGVITNTEPTAFNIERILAASGFTLSVDGSDERDLDALLAAVKAHHPAIKIKLLSIKFAKL